jgi:hypothetical protein
MRIDPAINIEDLHRMAKRRLPKIAFDFSEERNIRNGVPNIRRSVPGIEPKTLDPRRGADPIPARCTRGGGATPNRDSASLGVDSLARAPHA